MNFIRDLINKYQDDIGKVILYEDREEHAIKFEAFLKYISPSAFIFLFIARGQHIDCEVVRVVPTVTFIPEDQEIELVRILMEKNTPQLKISEIPKYTGIFILFYFIDKIFQSSAVPLFS
jgi:HAD domain family 1 in Swiss Army Knife RNA repair proteins